MMGRTDLVSRINDAVKTESRSRRNPARDSFWRMFHSLERHGVAGIFCGFFFLSGCVVYEPAPAYAPPPTSSFDRSWNAAIGAAQDVGVRITSEDRARGVITGANDSRNVTINVMTQADGRVRVEISARGPQGGDANLANDMSRAYDRRMGR